MILYINTISRDKIILGLDGRKFEYNSGQEKSQLLISLIEDLLNKNNLKFSDISSIKVEIGPGSFTGIRVGVSVANAFGWALKVPVNGILVNESNCVLPKY